MGLINLKDQVYVENPLLQEHWGTVIDNIDPEDRQRIKVSIPGVLEGSPEDLPWAIRHGDFVRGNSQEIPAIGDGVKITFLNGDIYSPIYGGRFYSLKADEAFKKLFPTPDYHGIVDENGNADVASTKSGRYIRQQAVKYATRVIENKGIFSNPKGLMDLTFSDGVANFTVDGYVNVHYSIDDVMDSLFEDDEDMANLPPANKISTASRQMTEWAMAQVALIESIPDRDALQKFAEDKVDKWVERLPNIISKRIENVKPMVDAATAVYQFIVNFDITKIVDAITGLLKAQLLLIKPYVSAYYATIMLIKDFTTCYEAISSALERKAAELGGSYTKKSLTLPNLPNLPKLPEL